MALIQAVKQGHVRGIKLLIDNGDTLSLSSSVLGTTALIEACKFDDKDVARKMIKVLLKNGASLNDRDYLGRNALHWACIGGHVEIVNDLLGLYRPGQPLDLTMTDYEGNSILHYAVINGKCSFMRHICKIYKRYGVTDWGRNKHGYLAADLALNHGHKHCAVLVKSVTNSSELDDVKTSEPKKISIDNRRKQKYLELPLIEESGSLTSTKSNPRSKKHSIHRKQTKTPETNLVPLSFAQRKISEEILGKISYRNLLADMNLIQSIEYSSSYRQGVDESVRLKRLEMAAKKVTLPILANNDDSRTNKKVPKRTKNDVPHFRPNRRRDREKNGKAKHSNSKPTRK